MIFKNEAFERLKRWKTDFHNFIKLKKIVWGSFVENLFFFSTRWVELKALSKGELTMYTLSARLLPWLLLHFHICNNNLELRIWSLRFFLGTNYSHSSLVNELWQSVWDCSYDWTAQICPVRKCSLLPLEKFPSRIYRQDLTKGDHTLDLHEVPLALNLIAWFDQEYQCLEKDLRANKRFSLQQPR